ncbi:hypothetical protein D3C86_1802640 [compost metagenome]
MPDRLLLDLAERALPLLGRAACLHPVFGECRVDVPQAEPLLAFEQGVELVDDAGFELRKLAELVGGHGLDLVEEGRPVQLRDLGGALRVHHPAGFQGFLLAHRGGEALEGRFARHGVL